MFKWLNWPRGQGQFRYHAQYSGVFHQSGLRQLVYEAIQGERDQFGPGNKFITPTIANGKVYVGTTDGVAVFGLLHRSTP